jgi:hypothetical protein
LALYATRDRQFAPRPIFKARENASINVSIIAHLRSFKLRLSGSAQVATRPFGCPPKPQGYEVKVPTLAVFSAYPTYQQDC